MSETQVQEFAGRLFDMAREGNLDLLAYIDHTACFDEPFASESFG